MNLTQPTQIVKLFSLSVLFAGAFSPSHSWSFSEDNNKPFKTDSSKSEQSDGAQHITITSRKSPLAGLAPTTQSKFIINPEKLAKIASSLTELVEGTPGVAENSQPGLFQVVSIRGVSRQRILTLFDGVRLSSERRAGTSASFIDPSLLQGVSITRGPASTYYGSGAMGGLMQLDLKQILGNEFSTGFDSNGNEKFQNYSWGAEADSNENHISITRRKANNSEDINGNPLNTHFKQISGLYQNSMDIQKSSAMPFLNQSRIDSWFFTSKGSNLGRSNVLFPNRIVNVPDEFHHIVKTSITGANQWSADFYIHDQSITTQTIRASQSITDVTNESQDFGFNWQLGWKGKDKLNNNQKENWSSSNLFGIDFYSRRNVNSEESTTDFSNNQITNSQTLIDARKDELAAFYSYHFQHENIRLQAGGRLTSEDSQNQLSNSQSNTALTAFAGIAYDIFKQENSENHFEINANIGNAFRFPSLTELYFSGTTARGQIQGNENLDAEESISIEIGFNWSKESGLLKMTLFRNEFDQYIERVSIGTNPQGDDILTYVNQQHGTIKGLETEVQFQLSQNFELNLIATIIDGKNKRQEALADIPSDRASLSINYHNNAWSTQFKLQHRRSKTDFSEGESATKSANLLSASFQYQLNPNWLFKIVGENLFDTEYVSSADDLATLMPGRSFGFNVIWHNDQK